MAKKENRISVNAFEAAAKEGFCPQTTVNWRGIEVTVKHTIPLKEMLSFVSEVINICFTDEGDYLPEVVHFAIDSGILTHYANFTMPQSVEKQYWLVTTTDAVGAVLDYINMEQLNRIVDAVHDRLRYICDAGAMQVKREMDELLRRIEASGEKISEAVSGVSGDDLQRLVAAMADGNLTEDGIVRAYIDQTLSNSDDAE